MKLDKFALALTIVLLPAFSHAVTGSVSPQPGAPVDSQAASKASPADASCRILQKESGAAAASEYRDLHRDSSGFAMAIAWGADPMVEALTAAAYRPDSKRRC